MVYALISAAHQDRRLAATGPSGYRESLDETSMLPFLAVLRGRQRLVLRELDRCAVVAVLGVFAVVRWFGLDRRIWLETATYGARRR